MQSIQIATDRMAVLTNALLRLSQVTHWELQYQSVDMSVLAQEIIAKLKQATPQRQVEVAIRPKLVVQGDRELLNIALENLLGNAWKYTSKKSNARIEFGWSDSKDKILNLPRFSSNNVVYFIRDNGVGFDMNYADKLFNPFHRLHTATEFEGTGIGLSTVQRIIHRHNGQILANAAPEKGATFYFGF